MQIRLRTPVISADGKQVGRVERLIVDHANLVIQHVIIGGRLPTSASRRVPFRQIASRGSDADGIQVDLDEAAIHDLPVYMDAELTQRGASFHDGAPRVTSFGDLSSPHIGSGPQESGAMVGMSDSGGATNQITLSRSTDLISHDGRNLGRLAEIECDDRAQLLSLFGRGRIFQYGEVHVDTREIASCSSRQIHIALDASEAYAQTAPAAGQIEAATVETERVEALMLEAVDTIPASEPVRHALRRMEAETLRSLLVEKDDGFLGVVSEQDLRQLSEAELDRSVSEFVRNDIPLLSPAMPLAEARALVAELPVMLSRLPVVDDRHHLVGELPRRSLQVSEATEQQAAESITGQETGVAQIEAGMRVEGPDGARIGVIDQVLTESGTATAFIIAHGLFGRRHTRLNVEHITQITPERVVLTIGRRELKLLPDLED